MAFGVGANDVANAMGTSVGSKALSIRQAIIIAVIFEFAGTMLAGSQVTQTIRSGLISPTAFTQHPEILIYGMLASLLSAGIWLLVATLMGWPVSTTHSIVGAILGFGLISVGAGAIKWVVILNIVLSWAVTPIIAGAIAFLLCISIKHLILNQGNPYLRAKQLLPFYVFLVGFVIAMVTLTKGLKNLSLALSYEQCILLSIGAGIVMLLLTIFMLDPETEPAKTRVDMHNEVEHMFSLLMIFAAAAMAFAHGSNDVANAIGPVSAIFGILQEPTLAQPHIPIWILALGGFGIIAGLMMYGKIVIKTVGNKITHLTPSRGFSATIAAAITVILSSGLGLPISTTQTLVGAIIGVGLVQGKKALHFKTIGEIFLSWIITLPVGGTLCILFYYCLKAVFFYCPNVIFK